MFLETRSCWLYCSLSHLYCLNSNHWPFESNHDVDVAVLGENGFYSLPVRDVSESCVVNFISICISLYISSAGS